MYPKHYFDLFREDIQPGTVFVGMDFGGEFAELRKNIIEPSITDASFKPIIVDTSIVNESILMDILRGIQTSEIILFEISRDNRGERNGNTMYELGLAHATRLPEEILVLRSDDEKLLFDIATFRVKQYDPTDMISSKKIISNLLKELAGNIDRTRSNIINKTLSMLDDVSVSLLYSLLDQTHFSIPSDIPLDAQAHHRDAVRHLLELGILKTGHNLKTGQYAFHFTGLGNTLREQMRRERAIQEEVKIE